MSLIKQFPKFGLLTIVSLAAIGCTHTTSEVQDTEQSTNQPLVRKIPVKCKQPVQVEDIWKLEPALVRSGKIKENMSQAEKKAVILAFIKAKNEQYQQCLKSNKSK